ncbi:MAG: hypothetical protein U5N58_04035 [Actinomycetota bacterium]|nr:hypothetical protein [Actinomycetota bacterium]
MNRGYYKILGLTVALLAAGAVVGYLFFYFLKEPSVFIIDKFKVLQGFFGIREYDQDMTLVYTLIIIFFGNLLSTLGYLGLGYLKASLPLAFITGFFIMIFLFSGTIRHAQSIPADVILLVSVETVYRMLMLSYGEYWATYKNRNKPLAYALVSITAVLFLFGIGFEIYSIFYL